MTATSLIVYGHPLSGHVHRVELFLSLLGLPFERRRVELLKGEQKYPEFLAMNPMGQIPVLVDKGEVFPDSSAILVYLARQYGEAHWLPADAATASRIQRWLSIAAGELLQGPALARVVQLFGRGDPAPHREKAAALLKVLEAHLQQNTFLVATQPTIADIAMYSYTAMAPDGGVALGDYPAINAWLRRVEALPGFLPTVKAQEFLAAAAQ